MPNLLDQPTPPVPVKARTVTFAGGEQGRMQHEPVAVRDAKKRAYNILYGERRRREGR